jgi:hypothetical protein
MHKRLSRDSAALALINQAFSEFPIAIPFEILPLDQSSVDVRAPLQSRQESFSPPLVSIAISSTTQLLPALYKR